VIDDKNNGLGAMLKGMRKLAGMTQAEVTFESRLERTSITNIERGRQMLTVNTINAIAGALGYTVHVTFRRKIR
jgi:transcriptional regulator with XRE-family HTH domain